MGLFFLDTSALVKYYVPEPGTQWIKELLDARTPDTHQFLHQVFIATVTITEVSTAISILWRRNVISRRHRENAYARFLSDVDKRLFLLHLSVNDFYLAGKLAQNYPLKAYDAVQLASALRYNQALISHGFSLTFVSGDKPLLTATKSEGLATDNPFDHLSPQDIP